ncbi:BZ3500_MvSof-1268-A1-R1_Chr1-2g01339 [Microbotryum saponariae]|uniref:Mitochondrial fission 1 protein n=1 Tax=Microbotryum saponariae TaxID=289078 RepID=A0A2X0MWM5_9BASI|nr:BZ3500_MvSof-1268-A1-R1_Chr1-2g01339 [Microbotryum saponariae]SCZ97144.1 BZ3501_MvSof-1269-A2-R1_Chr1-2g00938 [Microbotryum saponariae]
MPSDVLPAAVDAQSPLTADELDVLRSQYETESQKGWVSVQTRFNYAWGSVKSNDRVQVGQGVALLMDLYRTEPTRRRECLYFLAVGHYKLGNYPEAKRYNGLLLQKEPSNMQARSLASLIDAAVSKEGYVGLAIAGGAATVAGLLLTALLSGGRKGR